jgi:hypothetical protein
MLGEERFAVHAGLLRWGLAVGCQFSIIAPVHRGFHYCNQVGEGAVQ